MQLQETIVWATSALFWIACGLACIALIDRCTSAAFVPWEIVGIVVGLGWIACVIIFWKRSRHDRFSSAAEVDQRMKLRDRIGSAISCGDREDAFATVVLDDALATVEQEQVETNLRNYFPLLFPKTWAWIGVLGLIFAATFLSPQWKIITKVRFYLFLLYSCHRIIKDDCCKRIFAVTT